MVNLPSKSPQSQSVRIWTIVRPLTLFQRHTHAPSTLSGSSKPFCDPLEYILNWSVTCSAGFLAQSYAYTSPLNSISLRISVGHGALRLPHFPQGKGSKIPKARANTACSEGLSTGAARVSERIWDHAQRRRAVLPDGLGVSRKQRSRECCPGLQPCDRVKRETPRRTIEDVRADGQLHATRRRSKRPFLVSKAFLASPQATRRPSKSWLSPNGNWARTRKRPGVSRRR